MIPNGMVLDKSTRSLQLKLGAAGAIPVTVDYYDVTPQTKTDTQPLKGASYFATTNGTTYVTICPAPAQGTVRVITYICVHDSDAGSETFTLVKDDNGTPQIQVVMTLATTESAVWTPQSGWNVVT